MALTPQQELDKKTKQVVGARVEKGKEFGAYQTAEKQLLAIQAEQQQNLAQARAEVQNDMAQNELLTEAAGVVAAQTPSTPQIVSQPVNPATQAVLSKYGMGQPRFQKAQSHQSTVTKQNVVINNNTTTNTTNNVAVPANIGGPIQGRPIQFKPAQAQDDKGKLKLWLDNTTNRMAERAKQRDRQFERREISLSKAAKKLMEKLENLGTTIGEKLDARKIGTTFMSQLKVLGFLFGLHLLTKNWRKIITGINRIESGVKNFYNWIVGGKDGEESGLVKEIKYMLGGDRDDIRSLSDVFRDLFFSEDQQNLGLWPLIRNFFTEIFEDRKTAVDEVIKKSGLNEMINGWKTALGGVFAGTGIDKIFGDMLVTLGNILSAVVGGTGALKSIHAKQALAEHTQQQISDKTSQKGEQDYQKTSRVGNGDTSSGDYGTAKRGIMAQDVDSQGNLKTEGIASGFRQGNEMIYALNNKNKVGTMDVMTGFQRLSDLASEKSRSDNPYIILPRAKSTDGAGDFFDSLESRFGIDPNDPEWKAIKLESLKHGRYKLVRVPKTQEEAAPPPEAIQELLGEPLRAGAIRGMELVNGLLPSSNVLRVGSLILNGYEAVKTALGEDAASKLKKEGYFNKYIIKMVPLSDPNPAISIDGTRDATRRGYGLDAHLLDRVRRVISRTIGMDDSFKFDLSDAASVNAVNAQLTKSKTTEGTPHLKYQNVKGEYTPEQEAERQKYFAWEKANKASKKAQEQLKKYNEARADIINRFGIKPEEEAESGILKEELKKAGFDPNVDYENEAEAAAITAEQARAVFDTTPSSTQAETDYINEISEDADREARWSQRMNNFYNDAVNNTQAGKAVKHAAANIDAATGAAADATGFNFLRTDVSGNLDRFSNRVASNAVDVCNFSYSGKMSSEINTTNYPRYNPDAAIDYLHRNLKNKNGESCGAAHDRLYGKGSKSGWQCASYVRQALATGFGSPGTDIRAKMKPDTIPGTKKDPGNYSSAWRYAQSMPDIGFVPLSFNGYVPQKGDVAVMNANPKHPMGHIAIYDGRDWLADYKYNDRGSMFSASNYAEYGNQAVVFRHFSLMNPAKGKQADLTQIGANSGTVSGAYVNYNKGKPLKYSADEGSAKFIKTHQVKWKNFLLRQGKSEADAERLSGFYAAQDALESGNGTDYKAAKYHNYGGMKNSKTGGWYHYDSDEDYFTAKHKMMESKFGRALQAKDAMEYAEILGTNNPNEAGHQFKYYTDDVDEYKAAMAAKVASANQYNGANIAMGQTVASGGEYEPGIEGAMLQAKGWLGQWMDDDGSFDISGFVRYLTDAIFDFSNDVLNGAADAVSEGKDKLAEVVEDLTSDEEGEEELAEALPEVVTPNKDLGEDTKKTIWKYTNVNESDLEGGDEVAEAEAEKTEPTTDKLVEASVTKPTVFSAAITGDAKAFQEITKRKESPEEMLEQILACVKKISGDTGLANDIASVAAQSNAAGSDRVANTIMALAGGNGRQKVSASVPKRASSYLT